MWTFSFNLSYFLESLLSIISQTSSKPNQFPVLEDSALRNMSQDLNPYKYSSSDFPFRDTVEIHQGGIYSHCSNG